MGSGQLRRREFISAGVAAAGTLALGPELLAVARRARAAPATAPTARSARPTRIGLRLPEGFSARVIARGDIAVAGTGYVWHIFSDGAATYATADGGWILVSNSESPTPVHLPDRPADRQPRRRRRQRDPLLRRRRDRRRLPDPLRARAPTAPAAPPRGAPGSPARRPTTGRVWECDPTGEREAVVHDALGVFSHEAVCVDRRTGFVYLSEDDGDGCFYRFRPARKGDLSEGALEVARVGEQRRGRSGCRVPDPAAAQRRRPATRSPSATQVQARRGDLVRRRLRLPRRPPATAGSGPTTPARETMRGDLRRRAGHRPAAHRRRQRHRSTSPPATSSSARTTARPTPTTSRSSPRRPPPSSRPRTVARFAKVTGPQHGEPGTEAASEVTGVCFDPRGERMYFASQRALRRRRHLRGHRTVPRNRRRR